MRYAISMGLVVLLLGAVVVARGAAGADTARPAAPAAPPETGEPAPGVLAAPTGPVGAAAVDPGDALTIYLGGVEGLFRSTDGGETWDLVNRELRYPHVLLVDPADPARLYAARRDFTSFLPLPGVYRSDDRGHTWRRLGAGLDEERVFALALDPFRRGTLYAGSWAGRIYKSTDGGEHWLLMAADGVRSCPTCAPGTVGQLLVSPVDGAVYALESAAGTFKSTDGGMTWAQVHADSGWLAVDPQRGDLYLAGRRLWRSGDGGQSWTDLSQGLPMHTDSGAYAAFWVAVNAEPLVLYTRYHRSDDGGATWEPLETPTTFVPRLLLPGARPAIYGSVDGQAGRYLDTAAGAGSADAPPE